jgi:hypothetical protein
MDGQTDRQCFDGGSFAGGQFFLFSTAVKNRKTEKEKKRETEKEKKRKTNHGHKRENQKNRSWTQWPDEQQPVKKLQE